MKLHELFRLNEGVHTVQGDVTSLDQLRGADGEFLAGVVNVTGGVDLYNMDLDRLPVRFGVVSGDFDCSQNRLTSLEGAPGSVGGYFSCNVNRLTSLVDAPGVVAGNFWCIENLLTSLVGVHRILKRVGGVLHIKGNEIMSGGIGLILVEGLTEIDTDQPAFEIINEYLGQGNRGVLLCQEALHEAGFEEFAKP